MRPNPTHSNSLQSVTLKPHQLAQITIPLCLRTSLEEQTQRGNPSKRGQFLNSLSSGASCGGSHSPRFLYGEIKLAKKVRGGCEENGCEGRSLELPQLQVILTPKEKISFWPHWNLFCQPPCQFHNYHAGAKFPTSSNASSSPLSEAERCWWSSTVAGGRLPQEWGWWG